MLSRRDFIKVTGASALGWYMATTVGWVERAIADVGPLLDTHALPKFGTPLLVPPAMPRAGKIPVRGAKNIDVYEIAVRQFEQQLLPAGYPATTVWGYGPASARLQGGPAIFNAPSLTIEAKYSTPVRVTWRNELVDGAGRALPHLLPVDPTLHWANPPGGEAGRDSRPVFDATPGRYTGPVPIVTHVHGAVGVGDESDGYAEAWYLPDAWDIPSGYATRGTWYDFFAAKAAARYGAQWGPGIATFQYPNLGRAAADWYHDHTLGMTRLNVYAGPAGFFILRGGPSDDVRDTRDGSPAVLPGPAPALGDQPGTRYYEIPLAIQDRSFAADGSLFYPDTRAFFDGVEGPYLPDTDVSPIWNPEFFGDTIIVNGSTWPFLEVERRRYRFRVLNGCQSRFLILDFDGIAGARAWVVGNEGGFLTAPVDLATTTGNRLLMAPAERADVILDFTDVPVGSYVVGNVGPDEPFGGGVPGVDFPVADSGTTGLVMELRVVPARGADASTPPQFLQLPPVAPLPASSVTRPLALIEEMSHFFDDAPAEALLGTITGDPNTEDATWTGRTWAEQVTENPAVGATETWELYNTTGDAHPMHIHEVKVELLDRQEITVDETEQTVRVVGDPIPPEPWETGRKDTVVAYPGQVTRVRMTFEQPGQFVWHCHIVEHEDNEMMRPYRIGPEQPGQPLPTGHAGHPERGD